MLEPRRSQGEVGVVLFLVRDASTWRSPGFVRLRQDYRVGGSGRGRTPPLHAPMEKLTDVLRQD